MRSIRLRKVTKSYANTTILNQIQLHIPSGKIFALLGPSGCGKTTLLRLIAGFEQLDSGSIYLGDSEITHVPANKRRINIVFQNYALFPHLNVFENIAYSLKLTKLQKSLIQGRVLALAKTFHLENHIGKLPSQLSGGQQQRVALARAIINHPDVLLLDEPLAALDFKLREKMLIELIDWQDKLQTTFIYVTHDPFEALAVADYMAIMNHQGEVEQMGTPKEIYEFPTSSFVAKFVGTTNLLLGRLSCLEGEETTVDIPHIGSFHICVPRLKSWMYEGCQLYVSIRPEKIFIAKQPIQNFSNRLKGMVTQIVYDGRSTQYTVVVNHQCKMIVFEQNEEHFPQEDIDYDDEVYLCWQKENGVLLEK